MVAGRQKVYEPENRIGAETAASSEPLFSRAARTIKADASAASTAESRFIAYAWFEKKGTTGSEMA